MTRHFMTLHDLGRDGLSALLARSAELKRLRRQATAQSEEFVLRFLKDYERFAEAASQP